MEISMVIGLALLVIGAVMILCDQWKMNREIRRVKQECERLDRVAGMVTKRIGIVTSLDIGLEVFPGEDCVEAIKNLRKRLVELEDLPAKHERLRDAVGGLLEPEHVSLSADLADTDERLNAVLNHLGIEIARGHRFVARKRV